MTSNGMLPLAWGPSRKEMEKAHGDRDAAYDGVFFVAVRTTGIFCRPSCPSRPHPSNVEYLPSLRDCLLAGYRPCRRCHPEAVAGAPPAWAAVLMRLVSESADGRPGAADLRALGVTPERARRWFREHCGMTFAEWSRAHRLAGAFSRLQAGAGIDDAGMEAGFESVSGFRDAFRRVFGAAPGQVRDGAGRKGGVERLVVGWVETPLGPVVAAVRDEGVWMLEFQDGRGLERSLVRIKEDLGCGVVPGDHPWLDRLRLELQEYFEGGRREFSLPLSLEGTPFQESVWRELCRIPHGTTLSYEALARKVGRPTGQRAVALANGRNRIGILVPCHRVIGKDGTLTGYGGGLWRKRLLLELERTGRLPGGAGA